MTCACLGSLTSSPSRTVRHDERECVSTWKDTGERVSIAAVGRCPRCRLVRALVVELCEGCHYAPLEAA